MKIAALSLLFGICFGKTDYPSAWMNEINNNFDDLNHKLSFNDWKEHFGKTYTDLEEESHHYDIFYSNWQFINNHNLDGYYNYTMRVNQFTDLTHEEFLYYIHGSAEGCVRSRDTPKLNQYDLMPEDDEPLNAPEAIDWTNINGVSYVTPVKNQGNCGYVIYANMRNLYICIYVI